MKLRTRDLILLFAFMFIALLTLPGLYNAHRTTVEASVQDTSKSDVAAKPKARRNRPAQPRGVTGGAPNDNCANAIAVTSSPFTDTQNTSGTTDETGEPQSTCTLQANSVWYSFTNAKTAQVTVATCNSDFDTAIMVWKVNGAACDFANFTPVACNDDFCGDGLQSTVGFTADAGALYKIQIGGFDGETGNLITDITFNVLNCPPVVINGTLGSGSQDFDGVQVSGNQTGRLNRNGVSSTCAAPKTCLTFDALPGRAFDAYSIPNDSGNDVCVSISLHEDAKETCNIQSNAYLNSYDPANICTNYLGDPGLSTGVPPTDTNFSVVVPAGQTLVVVVHTTNPGESGCPYTVTILGDLCNQFDYCVQDNVTPSRFILINSETGAYEYHDCSKGIVLSGTGTIVQQQPGEFCKIQLTDKGPNPKRPDRNISVLVNHCTGRGDASIKLPGALTALTLTDSNINNNTCECPE